MKGFPPPADSATWLTVIVNLYPNLRNVKRWGKMYVLESMKCGVSEQGCGED